LANMAKLTTYIMKVTGQAPMPIHECGSGISCLLFAS
jgi:hypothetical protein